MKLLFFYTIYSLIQIEGGNGWKAVPTNFWNNSVKFIPSPPFIYLLNHLFILTWIHVYLCSALGNHQILGYFIAQIVPALNTGSSFRLALTLHFDMGPSFWFF